MIYVYHTTYNILDFTWISPHFDFISGLAFDWLAKNLYWAEHSKGDIWVSNYVGYHIKTLHKNTYNCYAIAVDLINRWLTFNP